MTSLRCGTGVQRLEGLLRRAGISPVPCSGGPGKSTRTSPGFRSASCEDLSSTVLFEGATPPPNVHDEVRAMWHRGVFDTQRAGDGVAALPRVADA